MLFLIKLFAMHPQTLASIPLRPGYLWNLLDRKRFSVGEDDPIEETGHQQNKKKTHTHASFRSHKSA